MKTRTLIYGLAEDRWRILDAAKDMLCVSQVHQIQMAPANVECIIVEEIDGVTSVRFTNQQRMHRTR
jgi:hypothetical protein